MALAPPQPQYKTYKKNVKLAPGATLGFTSGKGYYSKPAPAPVKKAVGSTLPIGGGVKLPGAAPPPAPNYGALLAGEPDFTEASGNYQYNKSLAHQGRRARMRAALIRLGFQPGSADANALEGLDPDTAKLAAENTNSALAQLGLQRGRGRADLSASLASRGILDSGALRGGENQVQESYDQGLLGATQDYLNEQGTALSDEANSIAQGQQVFTAAKAAAALRAAQNPMFYPVDGSGEPGPTLDAGQGQRPDQVPKLAKPPVATKLPPGQARMAATQAPRYFTNRANVVLGPGQKLKFTPGRGYYAG
jgi:hypothetical protein